MAEDTTFKLGQALAAQRALRSSLGMQEELFTEEAVIDMVSDEIEASRRAGRDDALIAALVQDVIGKTVTVEALRQFYVPPEQRHAHGG